MIDFNGQPWLPPLAGPRVPVALADLPPVDEGYLDDIRLELATLLTVAEQLGAQTFTLLDDDVTFTVRGDGPARRWCGRLGRPGVVAA